MPLAHYESRRTQTLEGIDLLQRGTVRDRKQLLTQGAAERFHIIAPSAMKTLVKAFHLQKGPDGSGYYNGNTAFRPR